MLIRILGLGLLPYLSDYINYLDVFIVATSWLPYMFTQQGGFKLHGLKFLRVLRPLRTVKDIKALRIIVLAII